MRFGGVPVSDAAGCILAHSLQVNGRRFRKGTVLAESDTSLLAAAGINEVTVAVLSGSDVGEDEAASRLADALLAGTAGLSRSAAFTGRANIYADAAGIVEFDVEAVARLNGINPAITLATLPNLSRVAPRSLVATAKIITFAVPAADLDKALKAASGIVGHFPVVRRDASLIVTRVEGQGERLVEKGKSSVASRLARLGIELLETHVVPHSQDAVGTALASSAGSLLLLLTGSATSDPLDVGPQGLRLAGGEVHRFGIPVDPGNLLFHGELGDRPVIGLPGCARSPALNGADWILERIACGLQPTDRDLAELGVGGLLKEIPSRPQPRAGAADAYSRPHVAVLILAEEQPDSIGGLVTAAQASHAELIKVVGHESVLSRLAGIPQSPKEVDFVVADPADRTGLLKAGVGSVSPPTDAVLLLRPGGGAADPVQLNRIIAAFSPKDGREICRIAVGGDRGAGPVLFGSRFFESLSELSGLQGEADLLHEMKDFLCDIQP